MGDANGFSAGFFVYHNSSQGAGESAAGQLWNDIK